MLCCCYIVESMTVYGLVMGPAVHYWYQGLDVIFRGKTVLIISKKILSDQLIASPAFIVTFFIGESQYTWKNAALEPPKWNSTSYKCCHEICYRIVFITLDHLCVWRLETRLLYTYTQFCSICARLRWEVAIICRICWKRSIFVGVHAHFDDIFCKRFPFNPLELRCI